MRDKINVQRLCGSALPLQVLVCVLLLLFVLRLRLPNAKLRLRFVPGGVPQQPALQTPLAASGPRQAGGAGDGQRGTLHAGHTQREAQRLQRIAG